MFEYKFVFVFHPQNPGANSVVDAGVKMSELGADGWRFEVFHGSYALMSRELYELHKYIVDQDHVRALLAG